MPSEVALSCRHSSVSAADKEGPVIHEAWGIHPLAPRGGTGQPLCSVKFNCKFCQKRNRGLPESYGGGPGGGGRGGEI